MRKPRKVRKRGQVYIFNEFQDARNYLYLYDSREERRYYFTRSFFQAGVSRKKLCVYAFPRREERYNFSEFFGDDLCEIELIRGNIKMLKEEDLEAFRSDLENLQESAQEKGYTGIFLKIDYGKVREEIFDKVLEIEQWIHSSGRLPIASISSFNMNFLNQDAVDSLLRIHDSVVVTTKDGEASVAFFHRSNMKPVYVPRIDVVSSKMMEHAVKKSLRILILSLLKQQPMCGFDIIKSLMHQFNVLLSQGTVYPILYSLEKEGYLKTVVKSDNKTKLYVPTEKAHRYIDQQIKEYILAQEKILDLVSRSIKWE